MTKEEEAAKLAAVCARLGTPVPQDAADSIAWKALAMSLAEREPEFQERGKPGKPGLLSLAEDFVCHAMLWDIMFRWDIPADIRKRKPKIGILEACRELGDAIGIKPETLKSRIRRFQKTTLKKLRDHPGFMTGGRSPLWFAAHLREERDKANKIMEAYMEAHPQFKEEVEDFVQYFNGVVEKC